MNDTAIVARKEATDFARYCLLNQRLNPEFVQEYFDEFLSDRFSVNNYLFSYQTNREYNTSYYNFETQRAYNCVRIHTINLDTNKLISYLIKSKEDFIIEMKKIKEINSVALLYVQQEVMWDEILEETFEEE
jgi:hypothetical protein